MTSRFAFHLVLRSCVVSSIGIAACGGPDEPPPPESFDCEPTLPEGAADSSAELVSEPSRIWHVASTGSHVFWVAGPLNAGDAPTHVFAHGTSAGSIGAASLVMSLGCEGQRLSGAVLDSWMLSPHLPALAEAGCLDYDATLVQRVEERIGHFFHRRNFFDERLGGAAAFEHQLTVTGETRAEAARRLRSERLVERLTADPPPAPDEAVVAAEVARRREWPEQARVRWLAFPAEGTTAEQRGKLRARAGEALAGRVWWIVPIPRSSPPPKDPIAPKRRGRRVGGDRRGAALASPP